MTSCYLALLPTSGGRRVSFSLRETHAGTAVAVRNSFLERSSDDNQQQPRKDTVLYLCGGRCRFRFCHHNLSFSHNPHNLTTVKVVLVAVCPSTEQQQESTVITLLLLSFFN